MENLGDIPGSRDISDIHGLVGGGSEDAQAAKAPATPAQVFKDTDGRWQEGTPVDGEPGTFQVGETEHTADKDSTTFTVGQTVIGTVGEGDDEMGYSGTLERVTGNIATIKGIDGAETEVPASTLKPILSKMGEPLNVGDKVVEIHDPNQEPKTIGTIDNKGWVTFEGDPNMKISSKDLALKEDIQEEAHAADDTMSLPESEVESFHSDDSGVLPGFEGMQAAQASSPTLTPAGKDMYAVMTEYGTTSTSADTEDTASRTDTAVRSQGEGSDWDGMSPAGDPLIGNIKLTGFLENVTGPIVAGANDPDNPAGTAMPEFAFLPEGAHLPESTISSEDLGVDPNLAFNPDEFTFFGGIGEQTYQESPEVAETPRGERLPAGGSFTEPRPAQAGAPGARPTEQFHLTGTIEDPVDMNRLQPGDQVVALDHNREPTIVGRFVGTTPEGHAKISTGTEGGPTFEVHSTTVVEARRVPERSSQVSGETGQRPVRGDTLEIGEPVIMKFKGGNSTGFVNGVQGEKVTLDPVGGKEGRKYERSADSLMREGDTVWVKGPNDIMSPCTINTIDEQGVSVTFVDGNPGTISAEHLVKNPRCTTPGFPGNAPQPGTKILHAGGVGTVHHHALIKNEAQLYAIGKERPLKEEEKIDYQERTGEAPSSDQTTRDSGFVPAESAIAEGDTCLVKGNLCTLTEIGEDGKSTVTTEDGKEIKGVPNEDIQPASSLAGRVSKADPDDPKTNADKTSAQVKEGLKKLAESPRFQSILKGIGRGAVGGALVGIHAMMAGIFCLLFPMSAPQMAQNFNEYHDQMIQWGLGNRKAKSMNKGVGDKLAAAAKKAAASKADVKTKAAKDAEEGKPVDDEVESSEDSDASSSDADSVSSSAGPGIEERSEATEFSDTSESVDSRAASESSEDDDMGID